MRILYALQDTGNGNINRANEIIPLLKKRAEVDILVSGKELSSPLNFQARYRRKGIILPKENKMMPFLKTLKLLKSKNFLHEINTLNLEEYDFVINDFEPVTAWAAKQQEKPCIALSHHFAVLAKDSPKPHRYDPMAWLVLRYIAPCEIGIGFHYKAYDSSIVTSFIRREVRTAYYRNLGHYTVYVPGRSLRPLLKVFTSMPETQWQIFSNEVTESYQSENCWVRPYNEYELTQSVLTCEGIICPPAFERVSEAIYMKKKILPVTYHTDYIGYCNAEALKEMGIPGIKKISLKKIKAIREWKSKTQQVERMEYPDNLNMVINRIFGELQYLVKDQLRPKSVSYDVMQEELIKAN